MRARATLTYGVLPLIIALALTTNAFAQALLLDKPVRAGELILFPDVNDEDTYFYVNDKPQLAATADGLAEFSFLRYVQNVRSGPEQPEAREGEGGGIVHAVVALSVSDDQIRTAQQELRRIKPNGKIQGPVLYKTGKFSLVSSFTKSDGSLSTQVVGLGRAPILDGEKAAVSIQLTKQGAKILWESFNTRTPDIAFGFEMEMDGYRSPHRGVIEANFEQIYAHEAFGVGLASTYVAAEIRGAFDDLTRSGAIKVTEIGADEKIESLLNTAYNKLTEMMFTPLNGTGTADLGSLAGLGQQQSLLDRATTSLQKSREEARAENERIRSENRADEDRRQATMQDRAVSGATPSGGTPDGGTKPAASSSSKADGGTKAAASSSRTGREEAVSTEPPVTASTRAAGVKPPTESSKSDGGVVADDNKPPKREEVSVPTFAVVAAFEMKRIRQQGTFRIDLNKYTSDSITLRFDQNIGSLRSLRDEPGHFREVDLNDPLFVQREIVVSLDGYNAQDFGQYINFVTVHMRKKHAMGDITDDEVRIDRKNFNSQGNAFKLMYGWKNDKDRQKWFEYDYETTWSFYGGNTVFVPFQTTTTGQINLAPPFIRQSVEVQADPAALQRASVRALTATVFYMLGGREEVKQVTLNPAKSQLSEKVDLLLAPNQLQYEYQIVWRLSDGRTVTSTRKPSTGAIVFADELS